MSWRVPERSPWKRIAAPAERSGRVEDGLLPSGMRTVKMPAAPQSVLATSIEPLCSPTSSEPARGRSRCLVGPSAGALVRSEPVEQAGKLGLGNAGARVRDAQDRVTRPRLRVEGNPDLARGELEGVRQQVENDFLPISRSTWTGGPSGVSTIRDSPACSHAERKLPARSRVNDARSVGS